MLGSASRRSQTSSLPHHCLLSFKAPHHTLCLELTRPPFPGFTEISSGKGQWNLRNLSQYNHHNHSRPSPSWTVMDTHGHSWTLHLARWPGHNVTTITGMPKRRRPEDSMQKARNFKTNSGNTNVIVVKFVFRAKSRCKMRSKLDAKQRQKQKRQKRAQLAPLSTLLAAFNGFKCSGGCRTIDASPRRRLFNSKTRPS